MACLDLNTLEWHLVGWRPFAWRFGKKMETQAAAAGDIGPISARLPVSVQQLLLEADLIEDWNVGLNSLACEWVEHRHWDFTARLPAVQPEGGRILLDAPGLDYAGWILVDCVEAACFEGALLPHRIDLTEQLGDGNPHLLSIIFDEPPREQGQVGYTSLSRYFKPRYTYSWDWCPRIVPVGAWEPANLVSGPDAACEIQRLKTTLDPDNTTGAVFAEVECAAAPDSIASLGLTLFDGDRVVGEHTAPMSGGGTVELTLERLCVEPWYPNGAGAQRRYDVCIEAMAADGTVLWRAARKVGFKRVEWRPCEGAPADAEPWLCVVNGTPVFLQGANWVPPKALYHDATREDYAKLIRLYSEMGATVLRVWGGGVLEKHDFYDLCDEAGIMVWQELPMSSSGIENCPPYEPDAIATLERIALTYIRRKGHHASLLLWSGGNELTWGGPEQRTGMTPVDCSHPCIGALKNLLDRHDPDHRFIATSPTGPRFYADAKEYGLGLHHDIHGPWGLGGFSGSGFEERLEAWREYWKQDDSMFRSEVGMPGAATAECIQRYADPAQLWPPNSMYWLHTASWWIQWDLCKVEMEGIDEPAAGIAAYIAATQKWQAKAYAIAARVCKQRFPRCGGFIIWMGHDCFPCPTNNSVIDFLCAPKPAYFALQEVFRTG